MTDLRSATPTLCKKERKEAPQAAASHKSKIQRLNVPPQKGRLLVDKCLCFSAIDAKHTNEIVDSGAICVSDHVIKHCVNQPRHKAMLAIHWAVIRPVACAPEKSYVKMQIGEWETYLISLASFSLTAKNRFLHCSQAMTRFFAEIDLTRIRKSPLTGR